MARKNKVVEVISTNTQVDPTIVLLKELLKNSEEIKNILSKLKERFI